MDFLFVADQSASAKILAQKISDELKQNKKVLWLLSGGSNIPIAVETLNILKVEFLSEFLIQNLAVTLTDERFFPIGHPDTNWQQLITAGFSFSDVKAIPVLFDLSLEETAEKFSQNYKSLTLWAEVIIGQFGIGADGHIAGILPLSSKVADTNIVCAYEALKFTRISLTLNTIKSIDIAIAFVFGAVKKEMLRTLQIKDLSLEIMPAQILKQVPESYLYSDQI